ncbi:MAG: hypothetical protein KDM63_05395 [Verrucomicrobiae bacterium]|nr:hypothetical protein [Verrucomicrobiae bacterium]MCB1086458.1 hypothetical protein [Verrucomicrobiae bacterium]
MSLFVVGGNSLVTLDPTEESFDVMPFPVMESKEKGGGFGSRSFGNGSPISLSTCQLTERLVIVSLVRHDDSLAEVGDKFGNCSDIVSVNESDEEANGSTMKVNHGINPGIPFTSTGSNSLDSRQLGSLWSDLVNSQKRAIEETQPPFGASGHLQKHRFVEPDFAKASEATL